ncbi:MAG: ribosome biogenesis GTPase Der [Candidatus Berkelbacteria bacterium]
MEENSVKNLVALIGRPNVGKSTLFNRLVGKRIAIESPVAGTTRDKILGEVFWHGKVFDLIDLAGIEKSKKNDAISQQTQDLVEAAAAEAEVLVFVVDWNDADNNMDKIIARSLKKYNKKVIVAVNKADNLERLRSIEKFSRLGNFEMIPVSGITGKNSGDLLDAIVKNLHQKKTVEVDENEIKLAIIGRPNVGKSTLLNQIVGQKKAIVSDVPGTTRDIVDVKFAHKGGMIRLFDTAGIRRKGKIEKDTIESFSVLRTYRALEGADVVVLMIDASEGLVAQDTHILGYAKEHGKGVVLAVNKIDLVEDIETFMDEQLYYLQDKLNFIPYLPVIFISAENGDNVKILLNQVIKVAANRKMQIPQEDLNEILALCQSKNVQTTNIFEIKQVDICPPTFELVAKKKKLIHETVLRYLENRTRDVHPLEGTPLIFYIDRKKPNK